MKLSQYAKREKITYRGAWRRWKQGRIEGAYLDETGHVFVPDPKIKLWGKAAIYARVSSSKQKDDLERQVERLVEYANAQGLSVVKIVREIANGVNDERPKLAKLLQDGDDWGILVVEHKDRLSRMGFNWFELFLKQQDKLISVANRAEEEKSELMDDFVAIIYSFAARIYGKRGAKNRTEHIMRAVKDDH